MAGVNEMQCVPGAACPLSDLVTTIQLEQRQMALEIKELKSVMANVERNTEHLHALQTIAEQLKEMHSDLIHAATGRKQIPLSSHLLFVLIFGAALLFLLVERSDKNLSLNSNGLNIEHYEGVKKKDNASPN